MKSDGVSGFEQENRIAVKLVSAHGGPADHMPAAGAGKALDAGLSAADRDCAGRREQARVLSSWHLEGIVEAAQIRKARRKSDHGDAIVAGDMTRDDVVRRGVQRPGDVFEIDAMLAAVNNGDTPTPDFGCRLYGQPGEGRQAFAK